MRKIFSIFATIAAIFSRRKNKPVKKPGFLEDTVFTGGVHKGKSAKRNKKGTENKNVSIATCRKMYRNRHGKAV